MQQDREPPHNIEAEQQVLGALLADDSSFSKVSGFLERDHFYDPIHAEIFGEIETRVQAGQRATPTIISNSMKASEGLRTLGGPGYLARLVGSSVAAFAIRDLAEIVADAAAKRGLLTSMDSARDVIGEGKVPARTVAATLETDAGKVAAATSTKPLIRSHLACVTSAIRESHAAYAGEEVPGFTTEIKQADDILRRVRSGRLYVLAGRPGMAKTSIAQNFATAALRQGRGVFFGSLEMPGEEIANRFLSQGLAARGVRIPYERIADGRLSEDQFRQVVDEAKRQESWPLVVAERDVREGSRMRSAIRRAQQHFAGTKMPLGLVVIDYLQLLQFKDARIGYERASMGSDFCKSIAMEFDVPVIACAQLSREVERRDNPFPMMSDLRDSGKLEEDADVIILLFRKAYYLKAEIDACDPGDVERRVDLEAELSRLNDNVDLIIAKHRGGRTGTAKAFIDLACCHLTSDRSHQDGSLI